LGGFEIMDSCGIRSSPELGDLSSVS